jgi:hypothetical protein
MNEIDVLLSHTSINTTITWLRGKVDVAKKKEHQPLELIASMEYLIESLENAQRVYRVLEREFVISRQRNLDLESICVQLDIKLKEEKKEKEELLNLI